MFSQELGLPLPRHILEATASSDKAAFATLPYWHEEFVGTGPYRLAEFERGSRITLEASDVYFLGQPKIDRVYMLLLGDTNALVTNLLAGTVDVFFGPGLDLERVISLEERWKDNGRIEPRYSGVRGIFAQSVNPSPPVVGNAQFRKALYHSIDRQQLVDDLMFGRAAIAHFFIGPPEPQFRNVEQSAIRYEYDPRKAAQMVETLGYSKGPDGIFRDVANEPLTVEFRSSSEPPLEKVLLTVSDSWERLGVRVERVVIPAQRSTDREYIATFPAFVVGGGATATRNLQRYEASQVPTPENRWSGLNQSRYMNGDLDRLISRFFTTIPVPERTQILRAAVAHITQEVSDMRLFYYQEFTVVSNRIRNLVGSQAADSAKTWNSHGWDVR